MFSKYRFQQISILVLLLLTGCLNPYAQFYNDRLVGQPIQDFPQLIPHTGEPELFRGNDVTGDAQILVERGYQMIGYSSFNAGLTDISLLNSHARSLHASVVVFYTKYTETVSGSIPLTLPDTKTSKTTHSGNIYGAGGSASYSGSSTTTTRGDKTYYIPYSVNRSDYVATYWVKSKLLALGIQFDDLPNDVRQRLQRNRGSIITAVINDSPAFMADLLREDVIIRVGDQDITNSQSLSNAIEEYQGNRVEIEYIRGLEKRIVQVELRKTDY